MKKILSITITLGLILATATSWATTTATGNTPAGTLPPPPPPRVSHDSPTSESATTGDTGKQDEKRWEEARKQNKDAIDALIKKCQADIAAATTTADKEAIKTACYDQYAAIIAGSAVNPGWSDEDMDEDTASDIKKKEERKREEAKRQEEKKREENKKLEEKKREDIKDQNEQQKEAVQKQFQDEIKAMKKKCKEDVSAAAEADKATVRTTCEAAIKAKMDAQKLEEDTPKETQHDNKDAIETLKKKCQADFKAATTEADKEAIKTACYTEISALKKDTPPPSNNKNDTKKEIKDTIKDAKKETETAVKDTRKQAREEIKALKKQCRADVKAAVEADKATVKAACEATIATKREALRETIKTLRATQYAALVITLKAKFEARLATLSEADKQKYIDNFNKTLDKLLQKAEETGQDTVVLTLEASEEVLNSL